MMTRALSCCAIARALLLLLEYGFQPTTAFHCWPLKYRVSSRGNVPASGALAGSGVAVTTFSTAFSTTFSTTWVWTTCFSTTWVWTTGFSTTFSTTWGVGAAQPLTINTRIISKAGRVYDLRIAISPLGLNE